MVSSDGGGHRWIASVCFRSVLPIHRGWFRTPGSTPPRSAGDPRGPRIDRGSIRYKGRGQFSKAWIPMLASQSRTYTSAKPSVVITNSLIPAKS